MPPFLTVFNCQLAQLHQAGLCQSICIRSPLTGFFLYLSQFFPQACDRNRAAVTPVDKTGNERAPGWLLTTIEQTYFGKLRLLVNSHAGQNQNTWARALGGFIQIFTYLVQMVLRSRYFYGLPMRLHKTLLFLRILRIISDTGS